MTMEINPPSRQEFVHTLDFSLRNMHNRDYFLTCELRQYRSLVEISRTIHIKPKIISIGAGGAFVEEWLAKRADAAITIVDFPEALNLNSVLYRALFDEQIGTNLVSDNIYFGENIYDAALWLDNIEHLARDPTEMARAIARCLRPSGFLFITTDNLARISNSIKLLLGRSILQPARMLFSPVTFENEGVHRREYTYGEISHMLRTCGFASIKVNYLWQRERRALIKIPIRFIETLIPRFRPHMLVRAQKC